MEAGDDAMTNLFSAIIGALWGPVLVRASGAGNAALYTAGRLLLPFREVTVPALFVQ